MQKNCIFVVTHKKFLPPSDLMYKPIQVGRIFTREILDFVTDEIGDNIAGKNKNYCELTALYWVWKQNFSYNNIGMCHYRRYFSHFSFIKNEIFYLRDSQVRKLLLTYDIIVPLKKYLYKKNVRQCYCDCEGKDTDIEKLIKVMKKIYPEYLEDIEEILKQQYAYYCNMFVTNKKNFDSYCKWLFDILFEVEKEISLDNYTTSEARVFGYMSEILLNVWIRHNNLQCKELPVVNTEQNVFKTIKLKLRNCINKYCG